MVREARLSWEDLDGFDLPDRRDRFDLDDDLVGPDEDDRPVRSRRRRQKATASRRPARRDGRRDLSGADWLNAEEVPR